jgi:hypothetical protein
MIPSPSAAQTVPSNSESSSSSVSTDAAPITDSKSIPAISLVAPLPLDANTQIFNNYGPKPNEEFLLAYGFVLDSNPDDVVVLRLGGVAQGLSESKSRLLKKGGLDVGKRWLVKRDGEVERGLLGVMRILMAEEKPEKAGHHHSHGGSEEDEEDEEHEHEDGEWEEEMNLELDVLGALGQMINDKLAKLDVDLSGIQAREDVRHMCEVYRKGKWWWCMHSSAPDSPSRS